MAEAAAETKTRTGSVQSIERAFSLLEMMADAGGTLPLSHLANQSGLPLPTIHRLLRTLVDRAYIRQESSRRYAFGPRLITLGDVSYSPRRPTKCVWECRAE
jgi:IclR family transcriptional regulator, acetate operon repressor